MNTDDISKNVIDMEQFSVTKNANVDTAKELLDYLVQKTLPSVEKKLAQAYQERNVLELIEVVHRLHGGVTYCGVPRLQEALYNFEATLKAGKVELLDELYNTILNEIMLLRESYRTL